MRFGLDGGPLPRVARWMAEKREDFAHDSESAARTINLK